MIAELFYPKEMKQVIADLRAKDDLNEEAVRLVDRSVFVMLGICLFFLWQSYLSIGTFVILCATPIVVWYTAKEHYEKYMVPYLWVFWLNLITDSGTFRSPNLVLTDH